MELSKELILNITEIDEQHKEYLEIADQLVIAIDKNDVAEANLLFDSAITHIQEHFKTEEAYFEKDNYPQCKAHNIVHNQFLKEILLIKQEFLNNNKLDERNKDKLKNWLVNHIKSLDKHFANFYHTVRTA